MNGRLILVASLLASGCDISLPDREIVEDLRILEVRADPPETSIFAGKPTELTQEGLAGLAPNLEPVTFSALVAHPDLDAEFGFEWIRCKREPNEPGEPSTGFVRVPCDGEQRVILGRAPDVEIAPIALALEDLIASEVPIEAFLTSLVEDPRDLFTGLRANFNLRASVTAANIAVDRPNLEARKRLIIFDPSLVGVVLSEARARGDTGLPDIEGIPLPTLCTNVSSDQFSEILRYLDERAPNRRPLLSEVRFLHSSETGTLTWSPGDPPIQVRIGESVQLEAIVHPEHLEAFQVIDDNCGLLDFEETHAVSWFTNLGQLSDAVTSQGPGPDTDDRHRTLYVPPPSSDFGGSVRTRVWLVLRDGRGGSDSTFVDLRAVQ